MLALNVNKLGPGHSGERFQAYLNGLCCSPDVVFLQEVKLREQQELLAVLRQGAGPGLPYRATVYYAPGDEHSRGVAVLVHDRAPISDLPDAPTFACPEGRLLRVDCSLLQHPLTMVCVYAPTQTTGSQRAAFFDSMAQQLPAGRHLLVGGDFNCVLSDLDENTPSQHRRAGTERLRATMEAASLQDVWRQRHSQQRQYTHHSFLPGGGVSSARLDRWLLSEQAAGWVQTVEHRYGGPGDHAGVLLRWTPPDLPPLGSGGWRFPTYLLHAPSTQPLLLAAALEAAQAVLAAPDKVRAWEVLKFKLRALADRLHRDATRSRYARLKQAHDAAQAAHAQFAATPQDPIALQDMLTAQAQLKAVMHSFAQERKEGAEGYYAVNGENVGSRWFYELKHVQQWQSNVIEQLAVSSDAQPQRMSGSQAQRLLSAAASRRFSADAPEGLFRRPGPASAAKAAAQQRLLAGLQRRLTVQDRRRQQAEGPEGDGKLTEQCIESALARTQSGKMPGSDGLTYEVYKVLWPAIGEAFVAAANQAFADFEASQDPACLPRSWLEGIICLMYKGKALPKWVLSSYRPITLLNCDFKLLSLATAGRMAPAAAFLTSLLQTAFVDGRDIADNALHHLTLDEFLAATQQPAALLILDLEQAYDRVDRSWLHAVVAAMGFGPKLCTWLQLLLCDSKAAATANGYLSDWFPVRNGLAQGSPLSPLLWALQLEPLTAHLQQLQQAGQLHSPHLPDGTAMPPVMHHADDTKLLVSSLQADAAAAMDAVQVYALASNAKVHPGKCKGKVLGTHAPVWGVHAGTGVDFGQQPQPGVEPPPAPKVLGVPLTSDPQQAARETFVKRIAVLHALRVAWEPLLLSLVGRALVAKQVLANSLTYHAALVVCPRELLTQVLDIIRRFVVWSPLPEDATGIPGGNRAAVMRPGELVARLPKRLGGIALVDVAAHAAALQTKTVVRALGAGTRPWQRMWRWHLRRAAPYGRPGLWWVMSSAPLELCSAPLPPQLLAAVEAMRASTPGRLQPLGRCDARALLCEPLYFNERIQGADGQPLRPPQPLPQDWPMTLRELRAAWAAVSSNPAARAARDALTAPMREALEQPLPVGGWAVSADGAFVRDGSAASQLFTVDMSGLLEPLEPPAAPPPPGTVWLDACVIDQVKPRRLWTYEEQREVAAARPHERADALPTQQFVIAAWEDLIIHPPSHGHGTTPFSLFTVKACREHITLQEAARAGIQGPLRPAAWPQPDGSASHLQELEAYWDQQRARPRRIENTAADLPRYVRNEPTSPRRVLQRTAPEAGPSSPGWRRADVQPAASTAAAAHGGSSSGAGASGSRAAAGAAAAAGAGGSNGGPGGGGAGGAAGPSSSGNGPEPKPRQAAAGQEAAAARATWQRLWAAPVNNRSRTLGWKLLHGRLPVGLYEAKFDSRPSGKHCCSYGTCSGHAARRQPPLASISHLFLECPHYQPARDWLADTWHAISGQRPPLSAAVLLGDQQSAWPQYPAAATADLWNALRLSWLFSLWEVHSHVDPMQRHSHAVVAGAISSMLTIIRSVFSRCNPGPLIFDVLPSSILTRPVEQLEVSEFASVWARNNALCKVEWDDQQVPHLRMRLSMLLPVPAPLPPPPQPQPAV